MSTIKVNSIEPANAGSEDYFFNRAWANLDGPNATLRGSGNVSSVTDNSVGNFTTNFSNSLVDANYSTTLGSSPEANTHHSHGWLSNGGGTGTYTSTAVQVAYFNDENSGRHVDVTFGCIQVTR